MISRYAIARIAKTPVWIRVTQWGVGYNTDCRSAAAMIQGGNPCGTSRYWKP